MTTLATGPKVRVAMIGAGNMANLVHYPSLASFPDVEFAGICDLRLDRLNTTGDKYGIEKRYTDYKVMIEEVAPDAVYVIGPPDVMYPHWIWCLEHGLNLYIEKPMGITLHQARNLAYLAQKHGCITQVSFQRRICPMVVELREECLKHGPIVHAMCRFYKNLIVPHLDARDHMMDDGVHAIDTLRWICGGEVVGIESTTKRVLVPDINFIAATLHFDTGATGIMLNSWTSGRRIFAVEMHAPGICAEAEHEGKGRLYADGDTTGIEYDTRQVADSGEFYVFGGFQAKNREFIDCLRTGRQPASTFADAVKTMEVAERILAQSLLAERWQKFERKKGGRMSMEARARVLSILNHRKPDVVPWLGDLDYWVTWLNGADLMPEKYKGDGLYQLHRDLGVGFYLQGYFPFREIRDGVEVIDERAGDRHVTRIRTPYGDIQETHEYLPDSYTSASSEHFVKSWRDLAPLRYFYEHTFYEPDYDLAARRYDLVGDNGLVLCYLPKSPFMELVALKAGIEAVTYALVDAPEEFEATLAVMTCKHDEAAAIALASPAECLMIPENLSSESVGKRLYAPYVRPYEAHWIERIRAAGKYSYIHIDGTLRGLMREVSQTGFTVLEAVTPEPSGDIPVEELWKWAEPNTIIWGGLPGLMFSDLVSDAEFDAFVIRVLEVFKTEPRYVLGVADQVPPLARWERIARVRELVEKYGRY